MQAVYGWVHGAAHILNNPEQFSRPLVQRRLRGLLGAIARHQDKAGGLADAVGHFLKVSRSYWPGLFHCYNIQDLPRTNNDLEHWFGMARYQERRSTGRKRGSRTSVIRGPVRLVAAVATRCQTFVPEMLAPRRVASWQQLRATLEERRQPRVLGHRFRRNPEAYLTDLEAQLVKLTLPP